MIVVRLMGGLGNQMFQYSFARAKSLREGRGFCLDTSFLDVKKNNGEYTIRNFELDYFCLKYKILNNLWAKLYFLADIALRKFNIKVQVISHEGSMRFDHMHLVSEAKMYIGYYQCEKYFIDYREQIVNDFQPKVAMCEYSQKVLSDIVKNYDRSVSVHIRRGDYVSLSSAVSAHGSCPREYYLKAIEKIQKKIKSPKFYFFSDDIEWVKNEFSQISEALFVEDDKSKKSFEDMHLMSKCQSNIIANSSYSWWGAWLNQNPNKIVIAPERWFNSDHLFYGDIIPSTWMKI